MSGAELTASFTPRRLRPGAGGGRHQRERQPLSLGQAHAPDLIQIVAGTEQICGKLRDIHRASAADGND